MRCRHDRLNYPGSLHFLTTVAGQRGYWLFEPKPCRMLLWLIEKYRARYDLACYGYVLMPDHLHLVLRQSGEHREVQRFMANFKRESTYYLRRHTDLTAFYWRDRYDDVPLPRGEAVLQRLRYMLENPIRSGLVAAPEHYPWSSARDHLGLGCGIIRVTSVVADRIDPDDPINYN